MAALRPLSHSQPPTTPLPVVHRVIFPFLRLVCPRAQLLGLVRERQTLEAYFRHVIAGASRRRQGAGSLLREEKVEEL